MIGPCTPYLTVAELRADPNVCLPDPEPTPEPETYDEVLQAFIDRASQVMYALMGRQFPGACTVTRWPVNRFGCSADFALPFAMLSGVGMRAPDDAIPLMGSPRDITVKIDGAVFTDWYLRDGMDLVRADGERWPTGNDLSLPDSSPGTFTITWTFGPPTPLIVKAGAQELAAQYQLGSVQSDACKLPPEVIGVSSQGINMTIDRDIEAVRAAGPSLQSVMTAMAAFNPGGARTPPDAWSPDHVWELHSVGEDLYVTP